MKAAFRLGHRLQSAAWGIAPALALLAAPALAAWNGPTTLVSAIWGAAADQLGLERGDIPEYDTFPKEIQPLSRTALIVPDPVNRRVVVYRIDGTRRSLVTAQGQAAGAPDWPPANLRVAEDSFLTQGASNLQRYDLDGALVAERAVAGVMRGVALDGKVVVEVPGEPPVFDLYTLELEFHSRLTTSPSLRGGELPFELRLRVEVDPGTGDERRFNELAVTLPDQEIVLTGVRGTPVRVLRDVDGSIHVVTSALDPRDTHTARYPSGQTQTVTVPHPLVQRFDATGALLEELHLPADEWDPIVDANPGDMTEPVPRALYGGVTLNDRGDLFLWRRDAAGYRILRWEQR